MFSEATVWTNDLYVKKAVACFAKRQKIKAAIKHAFNTL